MSTYTTQTQTPRNARDAYRLIHKTLAEAVVSAIDDDFDIKSAVEYADQMSAIEEKIPGAKFTEAVVDGYVSHDFNDEPIRADCASYGAIAERAFTEKDVFAVLNKNRSKLKGML